MAEHPTMKSLGSMVAGVAQPEAGECERHGAFTGLRIPGKPLVCPKCGEEELQRDREKNMREVERAHRQAQAKLTVYHSGIPPRFRAKTFDDFDAGDDKKKARVLAICRAYADRFQERHAAGGGMIMCGPPGTGKTHLACAIGNHLLEAGRSALFISVLDAVRQVKQTYRKDSQETERQALNKFYQPDLLILDEVGLQFGSEAEKLILFEIINGRYERVLPTILMSNLPEDELGAFIGDRVLDRMREGGGVVLAFDWESRRKDIKTASRDMPAWVDQQ